MHKQISQVSSTAHHHAKCCLIRSYYMVCAASLHIKNSRMPSMLEGRACWGQQIKEDLAVCGQAHCEPGSV